MNAIEDYVLFKYDYLQLFEGLLVTVFVDIFWNILERGNKNELRLFLISLYEFRA